MCIVGLGGPTRPSAASRQAGSAPGRGRRPANCRRAPLDPIYCDGCGCGHGWATLCVPAARRRGVDRGVSARARGDPAPVAIKWRIQYLCGLSPRHAPRVASTLEALLDALGVSLSVSSRSPVSSRAPRTRLSGARAARNTPGLPGVGVPGTSTPHTAGVRHAVRTDLRLVAARGTRPARSETGRPPPPPPRTVTRNLRHTHTHTCCAGFSDLLDLA